jgi:thiosulfate/3-mercaptopyruvate sulfurtransferase
MRYNSVNMTEPAMVVEPDWLESRLADDEVRVIDASWYLPDSGRDARAEYAAAHLPGAVYLDLASDLSDPDAPIRNTIAAPAALCEAFASRGIGTDHAIVVYDRLAGFSAGRIWWALRCAGHRRVGLLDGGFARWQHERRPLTDRVPDFPRSKFLADPNPRWLADKARVLAVAENAESEVQIVDARSAARFCGEGPEHTRRLGHIPDSINVPYDDNLGGDPLRFLGRDELREIYEAAGVRWDRPVITTCGSGVTASLTAFALSWLGHDDVAVYDGSWAEWGDADDTPIEP